jgi:hypothetical protein
MAATLQDRPVPRERQDGSCARVNECNRWLRQSRRMFDFWGYTLRTVGSVKTYIPLLLLAIACLAQSASASFDEEYSRGTEQNPPGVTFTISTIREHSTHHLSDDIRFEVMFVSRKERLYTAELAGAGSATGASFDFVIQGPGMSAPIHSQPSNRMGYVCCGSKRRYLGPKPLAGEGVLVNLKRIERFTNESTFPLPRLELKPGDYAIFAQTRSVMRGWPKSEHDTFHAVSDLMVTSSNILHITILPDVADSNFGRP